MNIPYPRSVRIKWDIMVAADSALDFLCNLKNRKRNLTFISSKWKSMPIVFVKQTRGIKFDQIFFMGGALRMRCAYLNETSKVSVLGLRNLRSFCTGFAVFLSRSLQGLGLRAPGSPTFTMPCFSWCPSIRVTLVRLPLPLSKVHFLCSLLWASIWLLHGHDLPLKPVCICFVPSSHPLLILNNFCKFFSFETPWRSFSSSLQVYSRNLIYVAYYNNVPNSYKPARSALPRKELEGCPLHSQRNLVAPCQPWRVTPAGMPMLASVILPLLNTLLSLGVKPIWIQIPTSHKALWHWAGW